jgi:hypothetical protein
MRNVLIAIVTVAAIGAAVLSVVAIRASQTDVNGALIGWSRDAGTAVRAEGGVSFTLWPTPRVVARDVRLSIPGLVEIRAETMQLVAEPLPLLTGQFRVGGARLLSAAVALSDEPLAVPDGSHPGGLRWVELVNGRLIVGGGLPDMALTATVRRTDSGHMTMSYAIGPGGILAGTATITPADGTGGHAIAVRAARSGDAVAFDGSLRREGTVAVLAGRASLTAPGLAQSLAMLGIAADVVPLRAVEASADVRLASDGSGAVTGMRGQSDAGDVAGAIDWSDRGVRARLDIGRLPLDRLVPMASRLRWGRGPAEIAIRAAGLTWGDVEIGIAQLSVRRTEGALAIEMADAAFLDGSVAARIGVRADATDRPVLSGSVRVNAVDAERLMAVLGQGPAAAGELRGVFDWRLTPREGGDGDRGSWVSRLQGEGSGVLTGGRIGVGMFGLAAPLRVDGLSAEFAVVDGIATLPSVGLVAPPRRFVGRGAVDLASGTADLAFAPVDDGTQGQLPAAGFVLRGLLGAARIVMAPVALQGPVPPMPARPQRASPPPPPTPLPTGAGRGG